MARELVGQLTTPLIRQNITIDIAGHPGIIEAKIAGKEVVEARRHPGRR